jgi:hypothetical protein
MPPVMTCFLLIISSPVTYVVKMTEIPAKDTRTATSLRPLKSSACAKIEAVAKFIMNTDNLKKMTSDALGRNLNNFELVILKERIKSKKPN